MLPNESGLSPYRPKGPLPNGAPALPPKGPRRVAYGGITRTVRVKRGKREPRVGGMRASVNNPI